LLKHLGGHFSDELQSNVEGFGAHPFRIRCETNNAVLKKRDPFADRIIDIKGNEKTHAKFARRLALSELMAG